MSDKPEPLSAILAEMRKRVSGEDGIKYMMTADEALSLADRIEAAVKRERETADLRAIHAAEMAERDALAENDALRAALVEISQMCGVGPNEVSAIAIAHICDKALKTKGE